MVAVVIMIVIAIAVMMMMAPGPAAPAIGDAAGERGCREGERPQNE
jgi:hypothetical protein